MPTAIADNRMNNRILIKTSLCIILLSAIAVGIASCSKSASYYRKTLDDAEKLMLANADSAIPILVLIANFFDKQSGKPMTYVLKSQD